MALEYKQAGVDVEAGYEAVRLMKDSVESTFSKEVLTGIGGFGGLFQLPKEYQEPVLVSGTDGVGTKLKLAFLMDRHDTIGIDAVAMCVNDIICSGAKPLFFLDYIACEHNEPEKIASIVAGVAEGCRQSGCSLIGGETAEHPGMMPKDEYDIAGFAVGIVEKDQIIDGSGVAEGDAIIGLASSGVHSNGFSLVRKIFGLNEPGAMETLASDFGCLDRPLGEVLLEPTRIYVKTLLRLMEKVKVKAVSHITGGGFQENIPRMLPEYTKAVIHPDSWEIPPIFRLMQEKGGISREGIFNTFNMGIGLALCVNAADADKALSCLSEMGETGHIIGHIEKQKEAKAGIEL